VQCSAGFGFGKVSVDCCRTHPQQFTADRKVLGAFNWHQFPMVLQRFQQGRHGYRQILPA
jgi:hypothetical protein